MRIFGQFGLASLGLFVAFGLACTDSSAPVVTATGLARAGGDSQATLTGNQLANPLRVRVLGSNSQPFSGATVTWTVTTGTATPASPTAVSDSQGFASTTVTLGGAAGAVAVQAAVTNITPVTFTATACDHPVLAFPDTLAGALATSDCRFGGFYTDFFDLPVASGPQGVVLTLTAGTFDTWLELYLRAGSFLGYDDDIDSTNTNSQLTAILATGDYLLAPAPYNALTVGNYTMSAVTRPNELAGCGIVWVTRGVTVSDSVTAGDCVDSTSGRFYADVVALYLTGGTVLKVSHHSTAFDAALFLRNSSGISVAANNDSAATTTNAYIAYSVVTTGSYLLFVGTKDSVSTGAYTLSISSATTLSGSARRDEGPQLLRMEPLRMQKSLSRRIWSRAGN